MNDPLNVTVELIDDKIKFNCTAKTNPPITADYIPPLGSGGGYMPLELLLISLASCAGGTIAPILRKMKKNVAGLKITANGKRRETHPTGFKKIILDIVLKSDNTEESEMQKAIKHAEETFCPVWSMLKGNVEIETKFKIIK